MPRATVPLLLCILALTALDCVSSYARYTRPSGAVIAPGTYRVPRSWDYRADYRLPVSRLQQIVKTWIGVPYRYGGTSRKSVDCSGLVYLVFNELNKARMPRSTRRLKNLGYPVAPEQSRPGDLVFFSLGHRGTIDHVGICLGGGTFVHASSSKGVTNARLGDDYFRTRIAMVRRVF